MTCRTQAAPPRVPAWPARLHELTFAEDGVPDGHGRCLICHQDVAFLEWATGDCPGAPSPSRVTAPTA